MTITSIKITGANPGDFTQTNNCGSILNGRSACFINVSFSPKARGLRGATLQIVDTDPGSPQSVALTGTGR